MNRNMLDADNIQEKNGVRANSLEAQIEKSSGKVNLIIEDNTIYEIDEECMNCLNKERKKN